jgi:hypothetical protein
MINWDWMMKLKTNKTSIKWTWPKIENKKIKTEVETPTTKRVELEFSGKKREKKGKK